MTRTLRWENPPSTWIEGSPIGNGRLGAMVLGEIGTFHLQVNDGTVWSGTPDAWRAELSALVEGGAGPAALEAVRAAVRDDRLDDAEDLLFGFEGTYSQEFLPFVDLRAHFAMSGSTPSHRGRTLDLHDAIYSDVVENDLVSLRRRAFASRPDSAIHIEIDAAGDSFDVELELTTRLRELSRACEGGVLTIGIEVPVDGAPLHEEHVAPVRWKGDPVRPGHPADVDDDSWDPVAAASIAVETDGIINATDGRFVVRAASRLRIALSSATAAEDWYASNSPIGDLDAQIRRAAARATAALDRTARDALERHLHDIRPLLMATGLRLGSGADEVVVDRLGEDPPDATVVPALFQYGRYLLASSSRPGGTAVNLQGLWNDDMRPPWSSNYTTNINVQMHYWAAEATGLGETVEPLVHLLEIMADTGRVAARALYGADGWVGHHNTDLWGWPLPVGMGHGDPAWAVWMTGGTWLTTHLLEHHRFTLDDEWLRDRAWPILHGAAAFALDWLIDEGGRWLVTNPSTSPENHFVHGDGVAGIDRATEMDRSLIAQVLEDLIDAAAILGLDSDPLVARARGALPKIEPTAVGTDGRIREWHVDRVDPNPAHGHFSALVGLYPLARVDVDAQPHLARAAGAFISARSHAATGWPWAWSIALQARLRDGDAARAIMRTTLIPAETDRDLRGNSLWSWGGLVPTLLHAHRPFQLDVSFGFPAAVAEMLLQTHSGEIHLLPALPSAWPSGAVRGLRARGGIEIDIEWERGMLTRAVLSRLAGSGGVVVRLGDSRVTLVMAVGSRVELDGALEVDEERRDHPVRE